MSSTPSPTMILRRVFFERAVQRSIQRSVQTAALIGATPHALVLARGSTDNQAPEFEAVRPRRLRFPEDHGAHPGFRTEWWYLTGWLERQDAPPCGVQITFFRARTRHPNANPSRFAPTQLLFAHAALALPEEGRLLHDQRAARIGFGLAQAAVQDTQVQIGPWKLARTESDQYRAQIRSQAFELALSFKSAGAPLLQGNNGVSTKGPNPEQASFYYSRPQLQVSGEIQVRSKAQTVTGRAWLDHEWSSTLLETGAVGWDWVGINLHDGGSLTAFRIRDAHGNSRWQHVAWRDAQGRQEVLQLGAPQSTTDVVFEPLRIWRSSRSGADWPVSMRLRLRDQPSKKERTLRLIPLLDDQEVDARASTGGYYWEGAVRLVDGDHSEAPEIGRGYLELTGYAGPVSL